MGEKRPLSLNLNQPPKGGHMKVFRNRTSLTYILKLLAFTILIPSISFAASFVRVKQVGYPANGSNRAYLMTSGDESGATIAVNKSSGTTLFSGQIGAMPDY